MAKGDGSITEKMNPKTGKSYKPKKWDVVVSFGRDPITGKYPQVHRVVTGTKADAVRVRDNIRESRLDGMQADSVKVTFSEYAAEWLEHRTTLGKVSARTLEEDASIVNRLNEFIGDVKLCDISTRTVDSLYTRLKVSRKRGTGAISGTYLHKHHVKLNQILESAVNHDLMRRNPCKGADVPQIDTPEKSYLTAKELARLRRCVEVAEEAAYKELVEKEARQEERGNIEGRESVLGLSALSRLTAVRLGMATGARIGEVMGFRWGDVVPGFTKISVRRTVDRSGKLKDKPKTKAGRRTISLDSQTSKALERWFAIQRDLLGTLGIKQTATTPVVCSNVGTHCNVANFTRWWLKWRTEQGFPELKFHELRHTQATQLLGNNVPLATVSARLGHARPSITLGFYSHAIPEKDEAAAMVIGDLIYSDPEPTPIIPIKSA